MSSAFQSGYALLIGVGADLPNTINDAQGLADILKDPARCAYPPSQVELLISDGACRSDIFAGLDKLAKKSDEKSTVLIYFSGHGYSIKSSIGETYFLMPHGYNVEKLSETAISGSEFVNKLKSIKAQKLLLLLDCCHAGGMSDIKAPGLQLAKAPMPPESQDLLAQGGGRVVIASSKADEVSFAGKPYSAFTLALMEALCGKGVSQNDGFVRVTDLALHAREMVPRRTKDRQHPILNYEHADNFVLAYYSGGETQLKGLPFNQEPETEPEPGAWTGVFDQHGQTVYGQQINIVGTDNIIITGDLLFHKFTTSPPNISSYIRIHEFQNLVNERTKGFVGRGFIFTAIDDILNEENFPSGYIIITGEPGIGKTALMAELVKRKGAVHHFNISLQNIRSIKDFLQNVCAQLIARYNLDYFSIPPDAFKDSGFLSQLLSEAAIRSKDQKVLVLVDALDEAEDIGLALGANRLYLPQTLPQGVFFLITTRPKGNYCLYVDRQKDIFLDDKDPKNLEDVQFYIENFIKDRQEVMEKRIIEWNITIKEFIETIKEKSEGNFAYLVYILRDIFDGKINAKNIDDIRNLPKGLFQYYDRHWNIMKTLNEEKFEKYFKPVVCILATVREPVSLHQLTEWTGLSPSDILEVIREWREFLEIDETSPDETKYRIYHLSFQDFLEKVVGLKPYHQNIAQRALKKIFG